MKRRVAVTGMGVVTPLGNDCDSFFDALLAGRSGIRRLRSVAPGPRGAPVGGEVDFDASDCLPRAKLALLDRFSQFAHHAAIQASRYAGIKVGTRDPRAGVYLGTGMGGALSTEHAYEELIGQSRERLEPYTVLRAMNHAAAAQVSMHFGFEGPSLTYSSACSSAAAAIGEAFRAIRDGYIDIALAGGSEALLSRGALRAWEALQVLAPEDPIDAAASCRPFSKDRCGLVLAEGAGMVVLEDMERAERRGARAIAELIGYGSASDASQMTRPAVEGQVRAIQGALADAGIAPDAVGYINAHATGTTAGDAVEARAIAQVFGATTASLPVSSTKSMHGHMLGAAAAVEFIACAMALRHGLIPPTAHLRSSDPECALHLPRQACPRPGLRVALSNSFAFGGSNAVLVARSLY